MKLRIEKETQTIRDEQNRYVAALAHWTDGNLLKDAEENAEFIIRAVNAHEALLEAAKHLVDDLETSKAIGQITPIGIELLRKYRKVIAQASGRQP